MNEKNDTEQWDLIIEPKVKLLDLNLGELWRYRDLLFLMVKRDFTAQYKQTILGPLWHFIQPLFTSLIFLFVFGKVANIPTDNIEPKFLFYLAGTTLWNYFSTCFLGTSSTFIANAGIFGKVYFPRLIMPLSTVISNLVRFGIQFGLLLMAMLWFSIKGFQFHFGVSWLLIPFLLLMMAMLGLGLGIIISALTTKYRDFNVLIGFAVQLLMYATPVIYPQSFLNTNKFGEWIKYNPLSPIFESFRYAVFGKGNLDLNGLLYSFIFTIVTLFIGIIMFNKVEKTFMDTV